MILLIVYIANTINKINFIMAVANTIVFYMIVELKTTSDVNNANDIYETDFLDLIPKKFK